MDFIDRQAREDIRELRNIVDRFELTCLENRGQCVGKPKSSAPSESRTIKRWTILAPVIAAIIGALGYMEASYIQGKMALRQKQADESQRQEALRQAKSTEDTFRAGAREGALDALLELQRRQQGAPIQKNPDTVKARN